MMNGKSREPAMGALQLDTFLDAMDGSVCLLEAGESIEVIYANSGFWKMLGLQQDTLQLPCPLEEVGIHPDYLAEYEGLIRRVAEDGSEIRHIQKISADGKNWIWRRCKLVRMKGFSDALPVIMEQATDISRLIEMQKQLQESNERLRVAFGQTPHILWEVDIERKTYNIFDVNTQACAVDAQLKNFPESLIESGLIHPDSTANFRVFASELLGGRGEGSGNFIIRDQVNNYYEWVALSYHTVLDREGNPLKAIGIQEKLPDVSGLHSMGFPRRPVPEVLRHRILARIRVNLTEDFVEDLWMAGVNRTAWTYGKTYSTILNSNDHRLMIRGQGREFQERFSRRALLAACERGEYWSSRLHRYVSRGGEIRWMRDTVNLQRDPATGDVYLFACFSDAQDRHDWENLVESGIAKDQAGGLYDTRSICAMTEALLRQNKNRICAIAMIRITGGFQQMEAEEADKKPGCRTKDFIAVALSFGLGTDCLIGKYKEDQFLLFVPDVVSKYDVKRRIEEAFTYIRNSMENMEEIGRLRFIAGVVVEESMEMDYDVMLLRTSYLCDLGEGAAMDMVVFPEEDEDWAWTNLRKEGTEQLADSSAMEKPLSRDAQSAALHCVTSMLSSDNMEVSIKSALRGIGIYYHATRVYMLVLTDNNQEVTMRYEWVKNGRHSIRQVMSGMQLSKIPLLQRCFREKAPVFMESSSGVAEQAREDAIWYFIAFPVKYENGSQGFLCVENPRSHMKEAGLLNALLPYILKEHRRFRNILTEEEQTEMLENIPNLRSYMNVIYSLDSDLYSSMGAVALDVPDFSAINSTYGFEYGKEMLNYIAETLLKIFGKGLVFRTWDAEFVVLFPNTIFEVFTGRCLRLRTMLQRRYPRRIRLGYTWSDGVFAARNLVKEAKDIMSCESMPEEAEPLTYMKTAEREQEGPKEQKHYLAYYQPKVDMRSGRLVGAEALVRQMDEEGNLIGPSQFIEKLEKEGGIRRLDFFMLDSVLKKLSEWKKKGLPEIPVSVNISRKTLLNPTVLASILAIQSRYPDVPSGQIRLEITESGGDIERSTLSELIKNFENVGIGFELDDFGSRYANMSILSNIRFRTVKLDRSLINDLPENRISSMMVENIAKICQKTGMACVAEGVENRQQEEALLRAGCVFGQGFYYGRPMDAGRFEKEFLDKEAKEQMRGGTQQ